MLLQAQHSLTLASNGLARTPTGLCTPQIIFQSLLAWKLSLVSLELSSPPFFLIICSRHNSQSRPLLYNQGRFRPEPIVIKCCNSFCSGSTTWPRRLGFRGRWSCPFCFAAAPLERPCWLIDSLFPYGSNMTRQSLKLRPFTYFTL